MIDFHSHILPSLDDGSKSIEESIKMLKMLSAQGVKRIVATPHFYANDESVDKFLERREKSYKSLTEKLSVDLPEIILGAEVRYYNGISRMENLDKLFIGKSRLLLLEMPFSRWTEHSVEEIIQLSNLGDVTVVLAHFDRYLFMQSKQIQEKIFNSDILLQCNSECFESWFSRLKAFKLLNNDKIHFLGSDCHDLEKRRPNFDIAAKAIISKFGKQYFNQLVEFQNDLLRCSI